MQPGPFTIDSRIFGNDHSRSFENQTVRNIAHVSVGGRRVRVRVSNAFGDMPLRLGAAHVALSRGGASIKSPPAGGSRSAGNPPSWFRRVPWWSAMPWT